MGRPRALRGPYRDLARELEALGCTVAKPSRGGHMAILDRRGHRVGTIPVSSSDRRAYLNLRSDLRRSGVPIR